MAKKGMNLKYKTRKRERNKYNPTLNGSEGAKSIALVLIGVVIFLGLMYLGVLGLEKLRVFQASYTPKEKETSIDYTYIPIGTVFNRTEKTYYVMFDDYSSNITFDMYIDSLLSSKKERVYKVDMSKNENAKFKGETPNKKAKNVNELSISDRTLIKITSGKIKDYVIGSSKIEEYLK